MFISSSTGHWSAAPAPAGLHVRRLEALLQHEGVRHAAVAVARNLLAHVADGNLAPVVPKLQTNL